VKLKTIGKNFLCRILEHQSKRLIKKNNFKIITVVGSVGKTSTKLTTAKLLNSKLRVRFQDGNYNDRLTVPLVLFGHINPNIFNIFAWLSIIIKNELSLLKTYPYDVAILELGPDGPNQLKYFSYINSDLCVLTAIAAEHMEFFKTLDNVAREELLSLSFSKESLINIDDTPKKYLEGIKYLSYGSNQGADFQMVSRQQDHLFGQNIIFKLPDNTEIKTEIKLLGNQGAKSVLAATAVAFKLGWNNQEITNALGDLTSAPGRMQVLKGINNSIIIDDTYNASPIAVKAALDVLYSTDASSRIAILGSMNELGPVSEEEHKNIADYLIKDKIDLLVTIGKVAKEFIAPIAENKGIITKSFLSPYQAGVYVKSIIKPKSVVLAKGSQNGVFAEEAIKPLLENDSDKSKLVRQTTYWINKKAKQF